MDSFKYRCLNCQASDWSTYSTYWRCNHCSRYYSCVHGIPRLYVEGELWPQDKSLRDYFYNGLLGRYYRYIMPFLSLPVRPNYRGGWAVFFLIWAALAGLLSYLAYRAVQLFQSQFVFSAVDAFAILLLAATASFFARHKYLLYLLLLAVPVKLSLRATSFRPRATFADIHADLISRLQKDGRQLQVLDISTGTCNSLYRHGWMKLDAEYTGLDLSETMLLQGLDFMSAQRVPMDFVVGDAMQLPFRADSFDVVLNYGALNGYGDVGAALAEMARVAKPGGLVLILDEQLYEGAPAIERLYFQRVLSSHDIHNRFPVELLPPALAAAEVHQVYHFYYLFVGHKQ